MNYKQARETIQRCRTLRDAGKSEAVLRSEFQSALRVIFDDAEDKGWINHYVEGAEAKTKLGVAGSIANRFIDNLVGSTTIEYEPDLRDAGKRATGFHQVREHAAGLICAGIAPSQIRGVLSDTVHWLAYDVQLNPGVDPSQCSADDVALTQVEELDLDSASESSATQLVEFVRRHLAREQSRPLVAEFLSLDLGLDSGPYERSAAALIALVNAWRKSDTSVSLATTLWSQFVDRFGGAGGGFRATAYVDEAYVAILARLLSANVLAGQAILSDAAEIKRILDGSHFVDKYQLENMVERDYFGWLVRPEVINNLIPIALEIQHDLYAYDFGRRAEQDLFGRLMAQLARRSQRKLLGQEWTPSWLARDLAMRCLELLPTGEKPRIIDMCCGSGAILAEILNVSRERFNYSDISELSDVATGFDIDPLAVTLSKTTWVVALSEEIRAATAPIVIPIYHADSLFAVTPVSSSVPFFDDKEAIPVSLDGRLISLPAVLLRPENRALFDRIIDWAYDEAREAQAKKQVQLLVKETAKSVVSAVPHNLSSQQAENVASAAVKLANRMSELAVNNRNGIWAFILRNAYRPALLTGQFNGLVSNPPWLALSGLADNPYRTDLASRAKLYGIRPQGQSFLHLELGTVHLLHAIDRYLRTGAAIACLVPGTILNGDQHEKFRQREFLSSKRPVAFDIEEVWQVEPRTFKYPGAAVVGHKGLPTAKKSKGPPQGYIAARSGLTKTNLAVEKLGSRRTAWTIGTISATTTSAIVGSAPQQGADVMPRTAVCVEVASRSGTEFRVDTPSKGSQFGFAIKAAKELKNERFPGYAAPQYIFDLAQSENLVPFVLADERVPLAIPVERRADGTLEILSDSDIRRSGHIQTARRFATINAKLKQVGKGKSLQERIDERGKLLRQALPNDAFVVVSGAGGKHICAASVPTNSFSRTIIDQTLYWKILDDENEAAYIVAMLNSRALTARITPFNPKGDFGERHVHTLPYRLMPKYDPADARHQKIAALSPIVASKAAQIVASDNYLKDQQHGLPQRRTKLRKYLEQMPEYVELEGLCEAALS